MITVTENAAQEGGFTLVVPPVEFTVTCTYGGETYTVDSFGSFVQRKIEIPEGVDPAKVTTAIVIEPDGGVRHVPTKIVEQNGKYYAVINSLTNSTYALISNTVEFADVADSYAKDEINAMGARMIIRGVDGRNFEPDREITRAEFAAIVIRALGLAAGTGESSFTDVRSSDWFCGAVETAARYGLILGYDDGTFRPNDKITREQALVIISRAMKLAKIEPNLTGEKVTSLLSAFLDDTSISGWAKDGIASLLVTGVIAQNDGALKPAEYITRAEVAFYIYRMLDKADLI